VLKHFYFSTDINNKLYIADFGASRKLNLALTTLLAQMPWSSYEDVGGMQYKYKKESDIQVWIENISLKPVHLWEDAGILKCSLINCMYLHIVSIMAFGVHHNKVLADIRQTVYCYYSWL